MNTTLTTHEAATLRTILDNGGAVNLTMGRMSRRGPDYIRTATFNRLQDRGLVRHWRTTTTWTLDVAVTAAGCLALRAYEEAQVPE